MTPSRRLTLTLAWTALALAGCAGSADHAEIARFEGQSLSVVDLDAYLVAQPPGLREVPAGGDPDVWLEGKLRRLALERLLGEEAQALEETPEVVARRFQMRSNLLTAALVEELGRQALPSEDEVTARVAELAGRNRSEPVLDFQHIFFRTDRGEDRAAVRAGAEKVAAEARGGTDFHTLARTHSDSADATEGGLVRNVRPSDIDQTVREILAALAENEVSDVVESRTGLHLFRLVRRVQPEPPSEAQLRKNASNALAREKLQAAREELLSDLRARTEIQTESAPWSVGATSVDEAILERLLPAGAGEAAREELVDRLLLAEEAVARGLSSAAIDEQVEQASRLGQLDRLFNERRRDFDARLGEDLLRPYYDAQPALFDTHETMRVELIFVSQGRDSFATQKRLEKHVARLRAGADFGDMARRISEHKSAAEGGDLGDLNEAALARYGPNLVPAVAELDVGEVSEPIYCTGRILSHDPELLRAGFAIVHLAERTPPRSRSFEEALEDVRRAYVQQHRAELDEQLQNEILAAAGFEIVRLPSLDELARNAGNA